MHKSTLLLAAASLLLLLTSYPSAAAGKTYKVINSDNPKEFMVFNCSTPARTLTLAWFQENCAQATSAAQYDTMELESVSITYRKIEH